MAPATLTRAQFNALTSTRSHVRSGLERLGAASPELAEVVEACLQEDPLLRISSAAALERLKPVHVRVHVRRVCVCCLDPP